FITVSEPPIADPHDGWCGGCRRETCGYPITATCAACHLIGLLESPKIGDKAAWEKRIQANGDMDGLIKSAIAGKGAMPARGGNAGLSDAEVKAAVEFMMQ
ncbi:MAG: c-type cytochrome, partial [gamma proteobacterium symbiont of Lucinoma myriamae]|nr:c-type cytochrome [gamma proteobacterium symbiont of Lucinoma myriamae]MCU7819718.1 c-type cytochrome [gamma proteobacterium symbiont of Lucinoma myriamae]MCU7832110.1 c-type cytochrome [gamma proteobacterium symbiont of Lucinoma myriamae]